jgi:Spy/CpxP family protein refolding chaperone
MERRRVLGVLAGIGAAAILSGVAYSAATQSGAEPPHGPGPDAGPGMMMPGMMPHHLLGRMADQLGLTPEQRQAVKGFFEQAKPGFEQLHKQMRANAELLLKTQPDDPAYQTVVASVSQSAAELASQFVLQASQLRAQVHSVLTPEQRVKLVALEANLHARAQDRRAHGHGQWAAPPPDGATH